MSNREAAGRAEVGVAFFVAVYSILRKTAPQPALVVLGDMSVQGNLKPVRSLEQVDPIFFGDLRQAAFKALGLN